MALLLRQPRPGGADTGWRARPAQDPAVRRAPDVWGDAGATRAQREWAARVLLFNMALAAAFEGVGTATGAVAGKRIRGQLDADVAPEPSLTRRPGGTQEVEWVNYGADEEWYPRRLMPTGAEEAAEAPRLLPAGEPASLAGQPERLLPAGEYPDRVILYQGITGSRLQKYLAEGLEMSPEGYRGAGLYTTPEFEEAVGWVLRHGSDKNYVLRYEIEPSAWHSLHGKETGMKIDLEYQHRVMAEDVILEARPSMAAGFPRTQSEFDTLLTEVRPELARYIGPVEAVDYLCGDVMLPGGGPRIFGYEYAFKSRYAIQDVLNNPSVTRVWITEITSRAKLRNPEWRPISFPRR